MLADTRLWKLARVQSRQLFMAAILMDMDFKREFAILFTRLYPELMKQFVDDDHEHSISVTSESVQIYTVPSIARMLIAEHNLLEVGLTLSLFLIFLIFLKLFVVETRFFFFLNRQYLYIVSLELLKCIRSAL